MASMIPYNRYGRLVRQVDPFDLIDEFFNSPQAELPRAFPLDVEDTGDAYVVSAHVPGVTRDDVDVELNDGKLCISVDKKETSEDEGKNWIQKETRSYQATRAVFLKDASTTGLNAKLADGVLTVNVPKQQEKENVTKIAID
ncbi:MAG: Hsp20 family protein [Atopobiaceae bacterium]|nr:Hsp20 family protein [Atopobiaceae bacterium]